VLTEFLTSKRAQFNTSVTFTLCTTCSLHITGYLITGSIQLFMSHKEMAYIHYNILWKLHILKKYYI